MTLGLQVACDGEDAGVVVAQLEPARKDRDVGVVQLDAHGATGVTHHHRLVESAVLHPKVVQQSQRLSGEVAELRVTALGLQLRDDDDGDDHVMLVETEQCSRIGEQDGGVQDVGAAVRSLRAGSGHVTSLRGHQPGDPVRSTAAAAPVVGHDARTVTAGLLGATPTFRNVSPRRHRPICRVTRHE